MFLPKGPLNEKFGQTSFAEISDAIYKYE